MEHALAHHNGEESEFNRKYEWEDELKITTPVSGIVSHENASFPLQGELPDGQSFSHDVANMRLFEIQGDQPVYVGCSESILERFEVENKEGWVLKVFLKDNEPMGNPVPGIYIAAQEFPKALVF